ncbi:MAG: right-handed parallel beta-helix repeat-containing protein [Prevotella sp.]|nr:right-handed parallel beta-helix repeat-containing protein [Prevotella sp.]
MMKKRIFYTIMIAVAALLAACSDDDSFTTSPANLLTFSTDTVRLDTIFSRVPTATKTFWVYNRSGDGIRCVNIRLQRGNQTGFRVNVDGVYLGQSAGYQVNDIDVRDKDSVRVFVELTSPQSMSDEPMLVEDDLVFTLESGVQQKVNLNAYAWDAELLRNVEIKTDSTIRSSKPIVIYGGLKVDSSATLTVGAGTTLYFHNDAGIDVYGKLIADGTAEQNVVFRGDRIDRMFDYLPYDRVPGQWQGIHFHASSYENELNFTDIHSAYDGIVCDSSGIQWLKLSLYNSVIHNCQGYGLVSTNCVLDVFNCQITNTLNDCAAFFGGGVMLRHCTIAQFYPFDANRGGALRFANYRGEQTYPLYQFDVYNTLVTGYADDVVMGDFRDSIAVAYKFDHCLLRTPKDTTSNSLLTDIVWEEPEDTTTGGVKNFLLMDTDNLKYDFRLDSLSKAVNAGVKLADGYSDYDRLGLRRNDNPDIGAYEYTKQ